MTFRPLAVTAAACLLLPEILATNVQAQDASSWAGFTVGLQASQGHGSQEYGPITAYDIDGSASGVFVGYMMTSGAWAYGAELSYAKADYHEVETDGSATFPAWNFNHTVDLKARAGYAIDRALVYGVLGYGFSEWENGTEGAADLYDIKGAIFGFGVDYQISDRVFLGAEVLRRGMDADSLFDADLTTVTLRAGMKF